jgi:hypothetical protein
VHCDGTGRVRSTVDKKCEASCTVAPVVNTCGLSEKVSLGLTSEVRHQLRRAVPTSTWYSPVNTLQQEACRLPYCDRYPNNILPQHGKRTNAGPSLGLGVDGVSEELARRALRYPAPHSS